jgi:DUF1680 family protein
MAFIVDTTHSPNARLRPVGVDQVILSDGFWQPRREINRTVTIPGQHAHCEATHRLRNFRRAAMKTPDIPFEGIFFNDSDVYKWAEAAAWSLASYPDPHLESLLDDVIAQIAGAQGDDGYLNTYYTFDRAGERFSNLKDMHEIYCAGHLLQAAVAHFRATNKRSLLDVAIRLADYLDRVFGDAPGKRPGACGHEECEMALVELARVTGDGRYRALARHMVDARGRTPAICGGGRYWQDHAPFAEQNDMTGHAVRQLYLNCGVADIVLERDEPAWRSALDALWENFTTRRIYVTGGAGSRYEGEAFGGDYELTSERAYTETCAAIGSVMWNYRMLLLTGAVRYADLLEGTLYNAVLPGLSHDGSQYFYQNPLADRGGHRRQEWFGCACCPPNVARLLAQLPGYAYALDDDGTVVVSLLAEGTASIGNTTVTQTTLYPWEGHVTITANGDAPALRVRIPSWADGATVNDAPVAPGWVTVPLEHGTTTARIVLPLTVRRIVGTSRALAVRGQVALARGPLIYCAEAIDHPETDIWDLALPDDAPLGTQWRPDLLGGVVTITTTGRALPGDIPLYGPPPAMAQSATDAIPLTFIPYYAWANRAAGAMSVWLNRA